MRDIEDINLLLLGFQGGIRDRSCKIFPRLDSAETKGFFMVLYSMIFLFCDPEGLLWRDRYTTEPRFRQLHQYLKFQGCFREFPSMHAASSEGGFLAAFWWVLIPTQCAPWAALQEVSLAHWLRTLPALQAQPGSATNEDSQLARLTAQLSAWRHWANADDGHIMTLRCVACERTTSHCWDECREDKGIFLKGTGKCRGFLEKWKI